MKLRIYQLMQFRPMQPTQVEVSGTPIPKGFKCLGNVKVVCCRIANMYFVRKAQLRIAAGGKRQGLWELRNGRITSWRQKRLDVPTNEQVVIRTLVEIGEIHECCLQLCVVLMYGKRTRKKGELIRVGDIDAALPPGLASRSPRPSRLLGPDDTLLGS